MWENWTVENHINKTTKRKHRKQTQRNHGRVWLLRNIGAMPLITYNTKADFDNAYRIGAEDGHPSTRAEIKLNYNRAVLYGLHEFIASKLVEIFAWPTTTNILIVGCGFAWTAEVLENDYNYNNIVTTDTSNWVLDNQDSDELEEIDEAIRGVGLDPNNGEGLLKRNNIIAKGKGNGKRRRHSRPIKNESLKNNGSRRRIKREVGDIKIAITEEVITTLSDNEVVDLSNNINAINNGITRIHLTTELLANQDPGYNWKTLADWKALLPNDVFVSLNTWEVL